MASNAVPPNRNLLNQTSTIGREGQYLNFVPPVHYTNYAPKAAAAADAAHIRRVQITDGAFYNTNGATNLQAQDVDPQLMLVTSQNGAAQTFTFPTAVQIIAYIRQVLHAENVTVGLTWQFTWMNSPLSVSTIAFAAGAGITLGSGCPQAGQTLPVGRSVNLQFRVNNLTAGAESITVRGSW